MNCFCSCVPDFYFVALFPSVSCRLFACLVYLLVSGPDVFRQSGTLDFRLGVSGLRLLLEQLVLLPFSPDETSSPRLYIAFLD